MEQTELEQFKRILEAMLAELKQPLRRRDEIAIENSPDALDQVQSAGDREMAIRRLENDSGRLHNLMDALERIEEGTYGICTRCEAEISIKRLNAVPWTPFCLECQTLADQNATQTTEAPLVRFAGGSLDLG